MSPTRELAKQIASDFEYIAPNLSVICIYGGAAYEPQGILIFSCYFIEKMETRDILNYNILYL